MTKPPILVLASCLADGIALLDYEVPDNDTPGTAHQMLLRAENEGREDSNRHSPPDEQVEVLTAETAPLVDYGDGTFALGGAGDDGGEGLRVFQVPPPEQN